MLKIIENLFFYTTCEVCADLDTPYLNQNLFCKDCLSLIKKEDTIYCRSCGEKTNNCLECKIFPKYKHIEVFSSYSKVLRQLILKYKFEKYKNLSFTIAKIIEDDFLNFVKKNNIDLILPVPSSKSVEKERGFNHLTEILKNFKNLKVKISKELVKVKDTPMQVSLSAKERKLNLKNSFLVKNPDSIKNKNILVFDDVITTGTTIREVFYELKKANPKNIYAYIIANKTN